LVLKEFFSTKVTPLLIPHSLFFSLPLSLSLSLALSLSLSLFLSLSLSLSFFLSLLHYVRGEGIKNPGGVDRIPMFAGIYCMFRKRESEDGSPSESTKGYVPTRRSTMKDGCEYISSIENTGGGFRRSTPVNFNFLFLFITV